VPSNVFVHYTSISLACANQILKNTIINNKFTKVNVGEIGRAEDGAGVNGALIGSADGCMDSDTDGFADGSVDGCMNSADGGWVFQGGPKGGFVGSSGDGRMEKDGAVDGSTDGTVDGTMDDSADGCVDTDGADDIDGFTDVSSGRFADGSADSCMETDGAVDVDGFLDGSADGCKDG